MLLRELTGDLPLTSKAKSLLGKNTKDFFICLNTIIGGSNYLKDYVEDVNSILTKLYNEGCIDIDFKETYLNGVYKIKNIDIDEDLILPTTKSHLLRDRKQIDYSLDLKIKSHEQPLFKENIESPTSFDTLVALKYLRKKVQADNRGIEFTLSLSDMTRLMKAKRCYYTGVELTLDGSLGLSFDRKDSTLGYTRSNTISCSAIANTLKENLMESCDVQQHLSKKEIKKMLLKFSELL